MANFCPDCGSPVGPSASFCENCGARLNTAPQQPRRESPQPSRSSPAAGTGAVREGIPGPGFSDRVNHPEIVAATRKQRGIARGFAAAVIPLPFLGFVIYSLVTEKMPLGDAAKYGAIVSLVFLVVNLISFRSSRAENGYEATVIDRISRRASRHGDSGAEVTEYITVVRTAGGKKKKIVETEGSRSWAWNYLRMGDRFRYHPQFAFPYEKFDKATAPCLYCVGCQAKNPVEADRCRRCGLPLLK